MGSAGSADAAGTDATANAANLAHLPVQAERKALLGAPATEKEQALAEALSEALRQWLEAE